MEKSLKVNQTYLQLKKISLLSKNEQMIIIFARTLKLILHILVT